MKRIISLTLSLILAASLCSCGDKYSQGDPTVSTQDTTHKPIITAESESTVNTQSETEKESAPAQKQTQVEVDETQYTLGADMIIKGSGEGENRQPLKEITYTVTDPENTRGLSQKKLCHSHGPASDGKPHSTVVTHMERCRFMEYARRRMVQNIGTGAVAPDTERFLLFNRRTSFCNERIRHHRLKNSLASVCQRQRKYAVCKRSSQPGTYL